MADAYRIAIVGSGPAGLSAAARAAQLGLSHVLIEKTDHLSDTIYKYQKGKHVMATPSQLVLRSDMDFDAGKREKVLGTWDEQAARHKVNVGSTPRSKAITGTKGDFTIRLKDKSEIKAENVILGDRHAGQSEPDARARRRSAARPVSARRSRRICRRAYPRDRRGRCRHRECRRPRHRSGAAQRRHHPQPHRRFQPRQGCQRQGPVRDARRRPPDGDARDRAEQGGARLRHARHARRRGAHPLRPDHRADGLGGAARLRRELRRRDGRSGGQGPRRHDVDPQGAEARHRHRVQQPRPRSLSQALAAVRDDGARHLRDRRARRLSADQALHEPGL